jgi:GT2 family glycosyltransferase
VSPGVGPRDDREGAVDLAGEPHVPVRRRILIQRGERAMNISVVICAYTDERWSDLTAAVASVAAQTAPALETIVVIDHNPVLLERVRAAMPGVVAVANEETRGLSGARNTGIAHTRGELIAFLDDDAIAEPDWLAWLGRACADPAVLGVGGAAEPLWAGGRPAWFPEEFDWIVGCAYRGLPVSPGPIRNAFGGCLLVRREVFEAVGGFRSGIGRVGKRPLGCEETELCIRAGQRWPRRRWLYEPRARIHHRVPAARATWSYFRARCYAEGLSKALITRLVGAGDGLSTERGYALRALPAGVARGLGAALRGERAGLTRAAAIVAGLAITCAGYAIGSAAAAIGRATPTTRTGVGVASAGRGLPS